MIQSLHRLIAIRYIIQNRSKQSVATMMFITIASIFIGTFSLALITAIMNGFEKTVHQKLQNIHPQATIYSSGAPLSVRAIEELIQQEFPEIITLSPQSIGHVILHVSDEDEQTPLVAILKGIDPHKEAAVSAIGTHMRHGQTLSDAVYDTHIAIGRSLAERLDLAVGATVPLFYVEPLEHTTHNLALHRTTAIIGGIFETGIDEFDTGLILCASSLFSDLFPEQGVTQIGLTCAPHTDMSLVVARLKQRLALPTYRWQDLYPALVSALALEKYTMFFILLLITLVAAMNIISLISMFVTQKRADIAILRAMGLSSRSIIIIFMSIGSIITTIGALLGLGCACIASYLLERYPFIPLPHVYYVSHLPAQMEWSIVITVFVAVVSIALLATWFASQQTKRITIARILRLEG